MQRDHRDHRTSRRSRYSDIRDGKAVMQSGRHIRRDVEDSGMNLPYRIAGIPFHSRLWACTAQNFRSGARSLPPEIAEEVIRVSETDIFITYVPSVRELMAMGD